MFVVDGGVLGVVGVGALGVAGVEVGDAHIGLVVLIQRLIVDCGC